MTAVSVPLRADRAGPARRAGFLLSTFVVAFGGATLLPIATSLALALAALVATLVWALLRANAAAREIRLEARFADALDLLGSSVAAGSGMVEALQATARDVRGLVGEVLREVGDRLRLGDEPQRALRDAEQRLPLGSFRLFATYLVVQAETGGALAPGLAAIAATVRDRVDLARRVHSQSAEVRVSVIGVLAVVYGIAALAATTDPHRVEQFLASAVGGALAAACVWLQVLGIVWIANLARIET